MCRAAPASDTAFGRKGTATSLARDILKLIEPGYYSLLVAGLGSGEGLVNRLRRLKAEGTEHRALVMDSEFGRLLAVMGREGSTLSPILRDAWDGAPLGRTLARQDDLIHEHHVCLMAHITLRELSTRLGGAERDNGFANRFLWLLVRRQRLVPFPQPPGRLVAGLWAPVARAIAQAPDATGDELNGGCLGRVEGVLRRAVRAAARGHAGRRRGAQRGAGDAPGADLRADRDVWGQRWAAAHPDQVVLPLALSQTIEQRRGVEPRHLDRGNQPPTGLQEQSDSRQHSHPPNGLRHVLDTL